MGMRVKTQPGYRACNLTNIAKKIRDAKRMPVAAKMRPLRNRLLKLAADSARRGACQRAGQEVRKNIAEKYPHDIAYGAPARRRK